MSTEPPRCQGCGCALEVDDPQPLYCVRCWLSPGRSTDAELAQRLVKAAETGFPGDRAKQIQQVSARAAQMPPAFTGMFLTGLQILADRSAAEAPGTSSDE